MQIDPQLAHFSDLAFRSAEVLYLIALAVSLIYYGMLRSSSLRRRERAQQLKELRAGSREKVLAGAGGASVSEGEAGEAEEVSLSDEALEAQLPERLRADNVVHNVKTVDKLGGITQSLVWLGVALHIVFVVLRGLATHRFPWGNLFEYVGVVTMAGMVISVLVIRTKAMRVMWPWILAPVSLLLFYGGTKLYAESAPVVPALQSYWLAVHVSTVAVGAGIGLVSGMASVMYLLRLSQPKGQERGVLGAIIGPMPEADKLDSLAYRSAIWTLPTLGLGIIFGAIWADAAWGRFWGWDPKETFSFISWVCYAGYLHARATPGWRGAKSAWINVIAFGTMVFNLFFINLVVAGLHSYAGLN